MRCVYSAFRDGVLTAWRAELRRSRMSEALEFFDEIDFELWTDPHAKFKGDVFVGVGAAVASSFGGETNGIGLEMPFLHTQFIAVESYLRFNYGEFTGIKI